MSTLQHAPVISPIRRRRASGEPFAHPSWQRAHAEAMDAIGRGVSVALLGSPGTGKTLLLEHLIDRLRRDGVGVSAWRSPAGPGTASSGVIVIDEADALAIGDLNAVLEGNPVVVMAGLPNFARVVDALPRTIVTITLEPLSVENIARFMAMRLRQLELPTTLFTPEAILRLAAHSAGLMRLVVILSGSAMFLAEQEGALQVAARHLDEAAALRFEADEAASPLPADIGPTRIDVGERGLPPRARRRSPVLVAAAAAVLAGICLWASLPSSGPRPIGSVQTGPVSPAPKVTTHDEPPPPVETRPAPTPAAIGARAPTQAAPAIAERPTTYQGPVTNVTMQQSGQLSLVVQRREGRSVTIEFRASSGLIGSGQLTGTMTGDGQISADGRLMMGHNPFDCVMSAVARGDALVGEANFTRVGSSWSARSTFTLAERN